MAKQELPIAERIAKLPEWARNHIAELERERNYAVKEFTDLLDKQTPTEIYTEEYHGVNIGELRPPNERHYIKGSRVTIEHAGILLRVGIYDNNSGRNCIHLQWEDTGRRCQEIAMVPHSFQFVKLVNKEHMS